MNEPIADSIPSVCGVNLSEKDLRRFWAKVSRDGPPHPSDPSLGNCWPWQGARNPYGSLCITRNGAERNIAAHRISRTIHEGTIPPGLQVHHSCDNPPCCNPAHLEVGNQKKNMEDRTLRKRSATGAGHGLNLHPERRAVGARNGAAKLTDSMVREMRRHYEQADTTIAAVARKFGMSEHATTCVLRYMSWRHVRNG